MITQETNTNPYKAVSDPKPVTNQQEVKGEKSFKEGLADNSNNDREYDGKNNDATNGDDAITNRDADQSSYDEEPLMKAPTMSDGGDDDEDDDEGEKDDPEIQTPDHDTGSTEVKIPNMAIS